MLLRFRLSAQRPAKGACFTLAHELIPTLVMAKMRTAENPSSLRPDEQPTEEQVRNTASEPSDEQRRIERRAYELYLERGGSHGRDWEDWLAAEREIRGPRTNRNE